MNGARELPVKIKPTLHLTNEDLDIGDVQVGENISLEINAKVKGISQSEDIEKSKNITEYTLEITNATVSSGLKKKETGQTLADRLVGE